MNNFSSFFLDPLEIIGFLKQELLLREICQKTVRQNIISRTCQTLNLTITAAEIQAEISRFRTQRNLEMMPDWVAWLDQQMLTLSEWETAVQSQLLTQKLTNYLFAHEIENTFNQRQADFDQVLFYQIVLPYERLAQELLYQIEENEISFYEAAHLYDIDEQRRLKCGYGGKLYRWQLAPELATITFNAKLMEVSGPFQFPDQTYNLIRVEEFLPAQLTSEIYKFFLDEKLDQWLRSELSWLADDP